MSIKGLDKTIEIMEELVQKVSDEATQAIISYHNTEKECAMKEVHLDIYKEIYEDHKNLDLYLGALKGLQGYMIERKA